MPAMLDPRIIRERRDEIVQSCRIRHVKADVDAVLAEQEKTHALLTELKLEQYIPQFEEEEMTSIELLEEIVARGDGEKELMDALKEMGIKKMGHRQSIVGAVVGKL